MSSGLRPGLLAGPDNLHIALSDVGEAPPLVLPITPKQKTDNKADKADHCQGNVDAVDQG